MTTKHLWAIGFDGTGRAEEVRDTITRFCRHSGDLVLKDVAVVVCDPDGCFTLDRQPLAAMKHFLDRAAVDFLTGVALAWRTAGATGDGAEIPAWAAVGIDPDFIREIQGLMQPGTSALFVLDEAGEMDNVLQAIRGLGGKVLKTNVDLDRARLIQSTLAAASATNRTGAVRS